MQNSNFFIFTECDALQDLAGCRVHAMDTTFFISLWYFWRNYIVDTFTQSKFRHSNKMEDSKRSALISKYGVISDTAWDSSLRQQTSGLNLWQNLRPLNIESLGCPWLKLAIMRETLWNLWSLIKNSVRTVEYNVRQPLTQDHILYYISRFAWLSPRTWTFQSLIHL